MILNLVILKGYLPSVPQPQIAADHNVHESATGDKPTNLDEPVLGDNPRLGGGNYEEEGKKWVLVSPVRRWR